MKVGQPPLPAVALIRRTLRDLVNPTGLGGSVASDGAWLTIGEVIARYRSAGFADSESTIRREVDDAVNAGRVKTYRTRGGHRRVLAADVDAFISERPGMVPPEDETGL